MAFQIKAGESVAKCVRRLARSQIEKARIGLAGQSGAGLEEVVHDVRKRFKRVRALIRLARPGLGRQLSARENTRFRDAGRPLSEVRDAAVLVDALDQLVDRFGDQARREAIGPAREALLRRKRDVSSRVLDEEDALAGLARSMQEAQRDVKTWEVRRGGWPAIEGGLGRIYERGFRAFQEASMGPTDDALHEWRKRVKDLWSVLDILTPVRLGYAQGRAHKAHTLADLLGDDHDLAVLRQVLSTMADAHGDRVSADLILPMIDRRRAELQRDAVGLGPEIYGEHPDDFIDRFRAYWRAWRAEVEAAGFESPHRSE